MTEAKHIETYSIIKLPNGKPARFIRRSLEAQYINDEGDLVGKKVRATDEFEVLKYPAQISYDALNVLNEQDKMIKEQ